MITAALRRYFPLFNWFSDSSGYFIKGWVGTVNRVIVHVVSKTTAHSGLLIGCAQGCYRLSMNCVSRIPFCSQPNLLVFIIDICSAIMSLDIKVSCGYQ